MAALIFYDREQRKDLDLLFSGKMEEMIRPGEAITAVPEVHFYCSVWVELSQKYFLLARSRD